MSHKPPLVKLFYQYVRNTPSKNIIVNKAILFCYLTYAVLEAGKFSSIKVYATSRMLKHLYDKKPAEEFDSILKHLHLIVRYPDHIYLNLDSKRGSICLLKQLKGEFYFCALESTNGDIDDNPPGNYVATCFRLRADKKENYLKKYRLVWSWKDGNSSS